MDLSNLNPSLVLLGFFLLSLAFSFLIFSILMKFAVNLGIRENNPEMIRWSSRQKPALGGICFYMMFLISVGVSPLLFSIDVPGFDSRFLGFVFAATLAFLMGLADDAYNTRPLLKLSVQIACGFILAYSGSRIQIFDSETLNVALTVLWVAGIMNSINMLDNMDAVAGMVSLGILISVLGIELFQFQSPGMYSLIQTGLIGVLIIFLWFNWHPSKIFMGDTGSQLLGIFLSFFPIHFVFNNPGSSIPFETNPLISISLIAALFVIPLSDTATVVISRILRGKSPMEGGRDHTTHSLYFHGLTERKIALLYFLLTLGGGVLTFLILNSNWKSSNKLLISSSYFLVIFITLFVLNRRKVK
jgi:UDP-GlcNAc:undecaprenyl-phosphate/decaprenyl-phosphate GlcNAc-1-phosphate transferase